MKFIFIHNAHKIHPSIVLAIMRFFCIICFTLPSINSYGNFSDSTFSDHCYFTNDGKLALVSELEFVRLRNHEERIAVFGLYRTGENFPNQKMAISNDTIYFLNSYVVNDFETIIIDSSFEK